MGNIVAPLWADAPACTRLLVVGYPVISAALMAADQNAPWIVDYGFRCMVETVVHDYCIWTMFTGAFYRQFAGGMSFLMMVFEIYMGLISFPAREKDLGSTSFFLWVLLMNFCTNVIFLVAMWLMSFQDKSYGSTPNQGFWPLLFICIATNCLSNVDGTTSFWGVVSIPNKWYPLCLLGFFCMMSQAIMWNVAAALVIGYAYDRLRLERALPSRVATNSVEQRCCGANGRSCLGAFWVRAVDTAGYELESGDRRYATLSDFGRSGQQLAARSSATGDEGSSSASGGVAANFVAFAGSGNRLGDGEAEPMRPADSSAAAAAAASARELAASASSARELVPMAPSQGVGDGV